MDIMVYSLLWANAGSISSTVVIIIAIIVHSQRASKTEALPEEPNTP